MLQSSSNSIKRKKKLSHAKDNLIDKRLQHHQGTHIDKATTNHLQLTTANNERKKLFCPLNLVGP